MLTYIIIVLAIAAAGGVVLATRVFAGQLAPWSLSIAHALLGATGLVMLIMWLGSWDVTGYWNNYRVACNGDGAIRTWKNGSGEPCYKNS